MYPGNYNYTSVINERMVHSGMKVQCVYVCMCVCVCMHYAYPCCDALLLTKTIKLDKSDKKQ